MVEDPTTVHLLMTRRTDHLKEQHDVEVGSVVEPSGRTAV